MSANDRREFLKALGSAGAALSIQTQAERALASPRGQPPVVGAAGQNLFPRHDALGGVRVDDPYAEVNWSTVRRIPSATHLHATTQARLDQIHEQMGLRHLPLSNYYPSAPYYPLEAIRTHSFVRQAFGVVRDGRYQGGPIDWNQVITDTHTGWVRDLPPETRRLLPMEPGARVFERIPDSIVVSPNAEHHSFSDTPLHACTPGSLFSSGAFDAGGRFGLRTHGYELGVGLPWREAFAKVFEQLLFEDGGGLTINHPTWSELDFHQIRQFLDFDHRVLGIEVYNDACAVAFGDPTLGWAVDLWDRLLASGRRCLGFFSPDKCAKGRNVLLVDQFNERECLRAYRRGAFLGSVNATDFSFARIRLAGDRVSVVVDKDRPPPPDTRLLVNVTTNTGKKRINAKWNEPFDVEIPLDNLGRPAINFMRMEAVDLDAGEVVYSQPIRFLNT